MKNKKKNIAIVYEGEKTEKALLEKMQKLFFDDIAETIVFSFSARGNIYMLWNILKENDFFIDVIDAIRDMSESARELLQGYSKSDFSEVYLFFDYDPHNNNLPQIYRNINVMKELLETFDNETDNGKLYISYPMIESMREIYSEGENYKSFYIPLEEVPDYKQYVAKELEFQDFGHLTREQWETACRASAKRAHLIVNYKASIPTYNYFLKELTQLNIYLAQLEKFVKSNKMVGVLNSVPLFLLEYFEESFWNQIMAEQ